MSILAIERRFSSFSEYNSSCIEGRHVSIRTSPAAFTLRARIRRARVRVQYSPGIRYIGLYSSHIPKKVCLAVSETQFLPNKSCMWINNCYDTCFRYDLLSEREFHQYQIDIIIIFMQRIRSLQLLYTHTHCKHAGH